MLYRSIHGGAHGKGGLETAALAENGQRAAVHADKALIGTTKISFFHFIPGWKCIPGKHHALDARARAGRHLTLLKTRCAEKKPEGAQASAKSLRATILQDANNVPATCKYECDTEFGCKHCIPADLTVTCPARSSNKLPTLDIEWIGDTGSAQGLISERGLSGVKARDPDHPINITTTNGPSSADKQFAVNVPSTGIASDPYVLPDTPAVLSIGQRCMMKGLILYGKLIIDHT